MFPSRQNEIALDGAPKDVREWAQSLDDEMPEMLDALIEREGKAWVRANWYLLMDQADFIGSL